MKHSRLLLAFLLSPLIASLTFIIVIIFNNDDGFSFSDIPIIFIVYSCFSYFAALVFGTPIVILFKILKLENIFTSILSGGIVGMITAFFISKLNLSISADFLDYLVCIVAGAMSGLVFWLILYGFKSSGSPKRKIE